MRNPKRNRLKLRPPNRPLPKFLRKRRPPLSLPRSPPRSRSSRPRSRRRTSTTTDSFRRLAVCCRILSELILSIESVKKEEKAAEEPAKEAEPVAEPVNELLDETDEILNSLNKTANKKKKANKKKTDKPAEAAATTESADVSPFPFSFMKLDKEEGCC